MTRFFRFPDRPRAGRPFEVGLVVVRRDTRAFVRPQRLTCSARVARRALRAFVRQMSVGYAECRWRIPRGTSGKLLTGTIAAGYDASTVRRSFRLRVR